MVVPCNNPPEYMEHVIAFIWFSFKEGIKIVDFISNMKPYVSSIVKSYEDTIILYLGKSGKP